MIISQACVICDVCNAQLLPFSFWMLKIFFFAAFLYNNAAHTHTHTQNQTPIAFPYRFFHSFIHSFKISPKCQITTTIFFYYGLVSMTKLNQKKKDFHIDRGKKNRWGRKEREKKTPRRHNCYKI